MTRCALVLLMLLVAGCGDSEPSLDAVTKVAKRELDADTIRCNDNAPPHTYHCDWTATSDYGAHLYGTAIMKTDGKRIWVEDPGG
jgi:hypothetical protein